jgi:hypothetical protein
MSVSTGNAPSAALGGRLLAYADEKTYRIAAPLTRNHARSGLILRGQHVSTLTRLLRAAGDRQILLADVASWAETNATVAVPWGVPRGDGLFPMTLDDWARGLSDSGADYVLTPSFFVRDGDWAALRAVLECGATATRTAVLTLVATDGAMLDESRLPRFLETLADHSGDRPLAFVFAGKTPPFARRGRVAGLRLLLAAHSGSLLLSADVAAATDALTQGAAASGIGVTGALRRPKGPGDDTGGGGNAADFAPGLFLRDIWEHRSPTIYADWYANSPSPTCAQCGGRALDTYTNRPADKDQILAHNVHAWLEVLTELTRRQAGAARSWLAGERRRALAAHLELRPGTANLAADPLLRWLCELDDPQQRRTRPTGAWT